MTRDIKKDGEVRASELTEAAAKGPLTFGGRRTANLMAAASDSVVRNAPSRSSEMEVLETELEPRHLGCYGAGRSRSARQFNSA